MQFDTNLSESGRGLALKRRGLKIIVRRNAEEQSPDWNDRGGVRGGGAGVKKRRNKAGKTLPYPASSISTECERRTIHFSTLSFAARSFKLSAPIDKEISARVPQDYVVPGVVNCRVVV